MMTNPKFFGIKRGLSAAEYQKPAKESNLPLGATAALPSFKMPPGKEMPNLAATAPAAMVSTHKPDPHQFLQRSSRMALGHKGVVQHTLRVEASFRGAVTKGVTVTSMTPEPPRKEGPAPTFFDKPRSNPPNSLLRMIYERGDMPCVVVPKGVKGAGEAALEFKAPVDKLDYSYYLPIFYAGLREEEYPLPLLAEEGIKALLAAAPEKVLPVIPQLIRPLREALNTRSRTAMVRALIALERLATCDVALPGRPPRCAQALVPYFRQLLPVMNIYAGRNLTTMDVPDYGQRKNRIIGERVDALLAVLEQYGGPDAYVNIRYMIPTYMSQNLVA